MLTNTPEVYREIALKQITRHKSFKTLDRVGRKYCYYLLNTDRHLFVKYCIDPIKAWHFSFQSDDSVSITKAIKSGATFICLICSEKFICALDGKEIAKLIDLKSKSAQWVKIKQLAEKNSCHVSGSTNPEGFIVSYNTFPDIVFA